MRTIVLIGCVKMRTRGGRGSKIPKILRTSSMNGPKWGIEVNGGRTDEGRLWTRLQRFPRERSGISSISTEVQPTDHVHGTNIGGANFGQGQRKRQNASERFHQNMLPHCPRINIEKGRAIVALGRTLPPSLSRSIKISIKD